MAAGRARKTPRARLDLEDCAIYLAEHASVQVALRFLECAEATFGILVEHPGFGRQVQFTRPELLGLRSFRVQGFENHWVVRVLHGARDLEAIFDGPDGEGE